MRFFQLLLIMTCLFFMAGCWKSESSVLHPVQRETVRLLGPVGVQETMIEAIDELLTASGIHLEKHFYYWDSYLAKARRTIINETREYDIIVGPALELINYIKSGKVLPLNDVAERAGVEATLFYPAVAEVFIYEDKFYALPYLTDTLVYIYRRDLYEKEKLTPPEDMREMYRTALKMTDNDLYGLAFPVNPKTDASINWTYFLWSFGGDFFDSQGQPVVNSLPALASAEFYTEILRKCAPPTVATWHTEEAVSFFMEGKLAAMISWSGVAALLENESLSKVAGKVGYAPLPPLLATKQSVTPMEIWGIVIPRAGRNIIGAKKFAELLVGHDFLETIGRQGLVPTALPAINRVYSELIPESPLAVATKVLDSSRLLPYTPDVNQYIPIIGSALIDILMGAEAQSILDEVNAQLKEIINIPAP